MPDDIEPLAGRRSGSIIILVGSLLGLYVPYLHMKGAHIGEIAKSSGGFFFICTAPRASSDLAFLRYPLGARTLAPATAARGS